MKTVVELVGDRELVMKRTFDAPRQLVWDAWTQREQIDAWWGPRMFKTESPVLDLRPGGAWHYCMRSEEWGDAWGKAIYREVVEPERLVYVDAFSDETGATNPDLPESLITVTFTEEGPGRTLLTVHTLYDSPEDRQKVIEMGVEQGFDEQLDRLEELLAQAASA